MKRLGHLFDVLLEALGALSAILLAFVTLGITAEILTRGFGIGSLPWMIEAVEYSLLGVTFFGAPWILKRSAHVRVDILVENLRPARRMIAQVSADVVGLIVCAIFFYYGLTSTIRLFDLDTRIFKVLVVKEWWLFAVVTFSCALMFMEFLRRLARTVSGSQGSGKQGTPEVDKASF